MVVLNIKELAMCISKPQFASDDGLFKQPVLVSKPETQQTKEKPVLTKRKKERQGIYGQMCRQYTIIDKNKHKDIEKAPLYITLNIIKVEKGANTYYGNQNKLNTTYLRREKQIYTLCGCQ